MALRMTGTNIRAAARVAGVNAAKWQAQAAGRRYSQAFSTSTCPARYSEPQIRIRGGGSFGCARDHA